MLGHWKTYIGILNHEKRASGAGLGEKTRRIKNTGGKKTPNVFSYSIIINLKGSNSRRVILKDVRPQKQ